MIRPFKKILADILPRMRIKNLMHAHRACKQAEACMNHRPLWAVPIGNDDVMAVTPFQFCCVAVEDKVPMHNNETEIEILKQLKSAQTTAMGTLWYKVRQSHLTALQKFHNQRLPQNEQVLKVGDLVLLKNDFSARSFWPIARITETHLNERGVFRTVSVEKYVPNEINFQLKKSLFGMTPTKNLTKKQLQQVTGFFKPLESRQSVKNLVRFELWNPEAEKLPKQSATIGKYGIKESLLRSHVPLFEQYMHDNINCKYLNNTYRTYSKQSRLIQAAAASIVNAKKPIDIEANAKLIKDRKAIGV
jgi:hypothetical protein